MTCGRRGVSRVVGDAVSVHDRNDISEGGLAALLG